MSDDLSNSAEMPERPFADAQPLRYIYVSAGAPAPTHGVRGSIDQPFATIQSAINNATPGTAIIVLPGNYVENVEFKKVEGTPENPIWLMSAYGPETVTVTAKDNSRATIAAYGEDNIIVSGFTVKGGLNGIQFSQSGNDFTNMVKNIVIENNIIYPSVKDGIKISQGENIYVANNTVIGSGDQGIDFMYVTNGTIVNNDVSMVAGVSAMLAKGGSENILIQGNYIHDVAFTGISVGGWSSNGRRPGADFEVKDILVSDNRVEGVHKYAVEVLGAHNATITNNYLASDDPKRPPIFVGPASPELNPPPISADIDIYGNVFNRAYNKYILVSADSTGVSFSDFQTDGVWNSAYWEANIGSHLDETPDVEVAARWFESGAPKNVKTGTAGDDKLFGTTYNDRLDGGAGADKLDGGWNDDTYVVDNEGDRIIESAGGGVDTAEVWIPAYTLASGVENLIVLNSAGGSYRGNSLDNIMRGAAGADQLDGDGGADWLQGGLGDDTLSGGGGSDGIDGGLGRGDVLLGGSAADEIFDADGVALISGGDGDDLIQVHFIDADEGNESASILGGAGSDVIELSSDDVGLVLDIKTDGPSRESMADGSDIVSLSGTYASANVLLMGGNDSFSGGSGTDSVAGGSGNDVLLGNAGKDLLDGGAGNDTLDGGSEADILKGGIGNDSLAGGEGNDTLDGGRDEDLMDGGTGADLLAGGAGRDTLMGGAGQDTLIGSEGNDLIVGGDGSDVMKGGAGRDTFAFHWGDIEGDVIQDFKIGEDILIFEGCGVDPSIEFDGTAWIVSDGVTTETFYIEGVTHLEPGSYFFL